MLSSLVPTAILAYYIYRYRYLEIIIQRSFVYASFALFVLLSYLFGVRRVSAAAQARYHLPPEVVEGLLILGLMFLAAPLRRFTERRVRQLFSREVTLYRDLVAQVGEAADWGELSRFLAFVETRIAQALELSRVQIAPRAGAPPAASELAALAEERRLSQIESPSLLARVSARGCYVLWREGRVVGLMLAGFEPRELTAEKREVLAVLAGHIAVGIANCELIEEKVRLHSPTSS